MNILDEVMQENSQSFLYPDEKIASDLYHSSLSFALRALAGMDEAERVKKEKENEWLSSETQKVRDVPVLDFDNIIRKLKMDNLSSCDVFFYNFCPTEKEMHFLVEMKNIKSKSDLLDKLRDEGKDGIWKKVKDSVSMIKKQLEFGGSQERDEIIANTHFFIVYSGKNDVPSSGPSINLKRVPVEHNDRHKQKSAGKMNKDFSRIENETKIYDDFGGKIQSLELAACDESLFPGNALPRVKKLNKWGKKMRTFSIFSSHDFAEIVDSGYFDEWKWGDYKKYFAKEMNG